MDYIQNISQAEAIRAYKVLNTFSQAKLPAAIAYKIYKLIASLKTIYDFQVGEEQKLFTEYEASVDGNGNVVIPDMSRYAELAQKFNEIGEVMHFVDNEKMPMVHIPSAALENSGLQLTIEDIGDIEKFLILDD